MRDSEVQAIALRASGVSSEGLKAIVTMLDHVRRAEGLPPARQDERFTVRLTSFTGSAVMKLSSARRRCIAVLRDVELPNPFHLDAFCDTLAAQRGRRLHLHPFRVSVSGSVPCGVYMST